MQVNLITSSIVDSKMETFFRNMYQVFMPQNYKVPIKKARKKNQNRKYEKFSWAKNFGSKTNKGFKNAMEKCV